MHRSEQTSPQPPPVVAPHEAVSTPAAPAAIGPYSQAITAGSTTYTAGQIALDPATGELVAPGDAAAQTDRVMANLLAVLAAAGRGAEDIVKTTIYLADLSDFAAVNERYEASLGGHRPARSTVQVARLPRGARVEIDAIAVARR